MTTLHEAAQQALEALDAYLNATDSNQDAKARELMAQAFFDLRSALAQQTETNADYERGFVDGMSNQAKSSVDKAVNRLGGSDE